MRNLILVLALAVVGVIGCGARETTVAPPTTPAAPPNVTVVNPPAQAVTPVPVAPAPQVNVNTVP
jgi:hypothetical protein